MIRRLALLVSLALVACAQPGADDSFPPSTPGASAEASPPRGLEGEAQPAFRGASRGGLHLSALPGRGRSDPDSVEAFQAVDEDEAIRGGGISSLSENRLTGTTGWMIGPGPPATEIEGYPDAASVLAGQPLGLHVSSTAPTFRVEVLRTGSYGGRSARLVWSGGPVAGGTRTATLVDPITRMVSATWPRSVSLPTDGWPPGAYLAKLIGQDGASSFVPFVVRDRTSTAAVLLVHGVATWQAYNSWGGPSTYRGYQRSDKAEDFELRSVAASFDRPYDRGLGTGNFLTAELPAVQAAERLGLHLNYAADVDLELHPEVLDGAVAVVLLGHSEYWSRSMRANVTAARDRGVNLAFLGANAVHRRIRLGPSAIGPGRMMINYKLAELDPFQGIDTTADWGRSPFPDPQASLVGPMFRCAHSDGDMVISDPHAWVFAGLGLRKGDRLKGLIGPEYDRVVTTVPTPRPLQVLAHSPLPCRGQDDASDMTWYSHASGAGVFASGTLRWVDEMASTDPTTRRVVTGATEQVLRMVAQPKAGARRPARDNVLQYYTADGELRGAASIGAARPAPSPDVVDPRVDPEADTDRPEDGG
jgi:hypothetical protein